jgi:hypothetical protein
MDSKIGAIMRKLIKGALDKLMGGEFDPSKRRAVKGIGALPVGALGVAGAAKGVRELFAEGAFDKLIDDVQKDFIDVDLENLDLSNFKKYFEDDKALSDWLDDGVVEDGFGDSVYADGVEEGWFQNLDERLDYVKNALENIHAQYWKDNPDGTVKEFLREGFAQPMVTDIILQKHPHLTKDEVRDLVGKMVK